VTNNVLFVSQIGVRRRGGRGGAKERSPYRKKKTFLKSFKDVSLDRNNRFPDRFRNKERFIVAQIRAAPQATQRTLSRSQNDVKNILQIV
jgi:hypothetical protein